MQPTEIKKVFDAYFVQLHKIAESLELIEQVVIVSKNMSKREKTSLIAHIEDHGDNLEKLAQMLCENVIKQYNISSLKK